MEMEASMEVAYYRLTSPQFCPKLLTTLYPFPSQHPKQELEPQNIIKLIVVIINRMGTTELTSSLFLKSLIFLKTNFF
jgi:hypothetical protein